MLVSTQFDGQALSGVSDSSVDCVISRASSHSDHNLNLFFEVYRVLRGDAQFRCYEPFENRTFQISEALKNNLTMAGFVAPTISMKDEFVEIVSKKPEWETGTAQGIKIKAKVIPKESKTTWDVQGEDDLVDEADLIAEGDKVKPDMAKIKTEFDCGAGSSGGKACKNCTCGRAELEAAGQQPQKKKLTLEMIENPGLESSCGSCGLGDAFRCAGCPYRGLPPFKPGEKIVLPDDFFVDDI
uniref:Anamorsin homolog n=1 Tax=Arcella intermedia TaxID=1963864 RepID=A0A6B2LDU9_9EUKA